MKNLKKKYEQPSLEVVNLFTEDHMLSASIIPNPDGTGELIPGGGEGTPSSMFDEEDADNGGNSIWE